MMLHLFPSRFGKANVKDIQKVLPFAFTFGKNDVDEFRFFGWQREIQFIASGFLSLVFNLFGLNANSFGSQKWELSFSRKALGIHVRQNVQFTVNFCLLNSRKVHFYNHLTFIEMNILHVAQATHSETDVWTFNFIGSHVVVFVRQL